uniref:Arrestin-C n=1 Tax=Sinocyclocheilus rhinocerous TaxID=307959 RepID=A0A673LMG4_9TELE
KNTRDNHLSKHLLQLCLYLGRRDFVDHVEHVDPVDTSSKLLNFLVWIQLARAFRYGREDLDVIGVSFRKDIWIKRIQMYPFEGTKNPNTPMQDALLIHFPCSVSLQPAPEDAGKPCGVDYEVKAYIANEEDETDEKVDKKDTCLLIIRKIQYAPNELAAGPKTDLNKQFITADKPIHVEASMERELYYHGDPIPIKVKVNNETSKVVKNIKISIHQITDVLLYSADKYDKCVLNEEFADQINANSTFEKEYRVTPLLASNKEKRGLSLDGKLKDEDTNLASSLDHPLYCSISTVQVSLCEVWLAVTEKQLYAQLPVCMERIFLRLQFAAQQWLFYSICLTETFLNKSLSDQDLLCSKSLTNLLTVQ